MASAPDYSSYNQSSAQQGYAAYAAQPSQNYGQTAQQSYGQQNYGSYAQSAAPENSYTQAAPAAGGYPQQQQQYGSSYGQPASAGYPASQSATHSYSQSTQGYGASGYDSTPTAAAAAAPAASQSYSSQPGYTAQSAYPGYGQQAAPTAPQSYNSNSQPTSYNQNSYSQPVGYGQQQPGYQAQQPSYSQQQGYQQQTQQQQQAPPAYPPQAAGSYGQPPANQYGQQGGPPSYSQSNHYNNYRQDGQGGGSGYSGSEPSRYPGAGDRGPGRDGFDRGGMMHRGRGGMVRGMGGAGDRGGFSKPGGPMGGDDRDMGRPEEQDDSENSTIYITGLTEKANLEEMAEFFKDVGPIRMNRRLGQPAINIYTDKDTGKPKGDATLSYEEPVCAKAAVEHFDGKEFQGRRLKVSMARRKPMMGGMRGGMPMRDGMMGRGASLILEVLGSESNHGSHEKQYPPWKQRLEAKIKAARREVSQITEAERGAMKRPMPKRYSQMPIPEALETAKQRLQALASRLKRYTSDNEARRINQLVTTQPAKVYSQWQGNNNRADPPRLETEQYWKGIWEREASHNSDAQWLVDLREDHSNLPEQNPVTIKVV